uniref:Uncharacterized protein n=1 Tax=Rosa rugosa TaxID=74645 RepID=J7FWQ3_ROSRU|nr:hypothetical protein [Rosa rugosa]
MNQSKSSNSLYEATDEQEGAVVKGLRQHKRQQQPEVMALTMNITLQKNERILEDTILLCAWFNNPVPRSKNERPTLLFSLITIKTRTRTSWGLGTTMPV